MDSLNQQLEQAASAGDGVSVRRWFAAYGLLVLAAGVPLALLLTHQQATWNDWLHKTKATFADTGAIIKLLAFGLYLSLCCTFLPLPTGWIVAGIAAREAAVTGELATTVLLIALVGAIGSTLANLNDYHLFTWMLRAKRVASVRDSKAYQRAAKWFARSPFFILVVFNVIPIPVDVVRMLAVADRYGRIPFAAANFVGRFIRYAIIAFVTFWWNLGWIAAIALLGLAVVMGAGKAIMHCMKRFSHRGEQTT